MRTPTIIYVSRWGSARPAQYRAAACGSATGARTSVGDNVVGIQRLVERGEPLGARRGTPPAALVERQLQCVDQDLDLLPRRQMRGVGPGAEGRLVQRIERGEP